MAEDKEPRKPGVRSGRADRGRGTGRVTAGHGHAPRSQGRKGAGSAGAPAARVARQARRTASQAPARAQRSQDVGQMGRSVLADSRRGTQGSGKGAKAFAAEGSRPQPSEKIDRPTRLRLWARSSAWDYLLVLVVSIAMVYTISYGFYSAEGYRGNIALLAGLIAPLLVILFAGSWSKRAVLFSALGAVALSALYIGVAAVLSPDSSLFAGGAVNDVSGNYVIFALVLCAVTAVVYLLSRRTVGLVFLLLFGVLACGIVQFMWREWIPQLHGIAAFVVVFLGIGMLFVYQSYRQSVYSADRVKRTSFLGAFAYSALIAVVCVAVGAGVFSIVEAVAPDTFEFKPFESYVSRPVDENSNTYSPNHGEDDQTSNQTNDKEQRTDNDDNAGNTSSSGGVGMLQDSLIENAAQAMAGYNPNDPNQDIDNVSYLIVAWELVILGVLLLSAIIAIVLLWRYRRKLRIKRISGRSKRYQAWYIYSFLINRFGRLKLSKPDQLTPLEYAVGFNKAMLPFTRGTNGVDFVDVSSVYQDAVFGGKQPTDDQIQQLKDYYFAFFKNARQYVGLPKWVLWKFWRV